MLPDRSVLIGQKFVENETFLVIFKQCASLTEKKARKSKTILGSFFMKYDDKRWLITKVLKQHKSEIDFCEENFRLFNSFTQILRKFSYLNKDFFLFWFQDHESNMFCRALKSLPFAYMFFYEYTKPVSIKSE